MHQTPFYSVPLAYYTINFSGEEENPRRRGMLQANRLAYLDAEPFLTAAGCRLRSSSDGLICVSAPNRDDVAVCNVSTGKCIFLPTIQSQSPSPSLITCALLGFDSKSKRYKVLMSTVDRGDIIRRRMSYKHWVLTVGVDKSWREINNYCSHLDNPFDGHGYSNYFHTSVCIDGVIYSFNWLTKDVDPLSCFHIVAFEVGSETFSMIPFPDEVPSMYLFTDTNRRPGLMYQYADFVLRNFALLEVDGGRLAIVHVHKIGLLFYLDVWTWVKSSKECYWEKITMTIPLEESRTINANGVRTSNRAGEIVFLCINSEQLSILVCNLKSKVWRKVDVGGVEEFPIISSRDVSMCRIMDNVFSLE